jgi:hypothetical protein
VLQVVLADLETEDRWGCAVTLTERKLAWLYPLPPKWIEAAAVHYAQLQLQQLQCEKPSPVATKQIAQLGSYACRSTAGPDNWVD